MRFEMDGKKDTPFSRSNSEPLGPVSSRSVPNAEIMEVLQSKRGEEDQKVDTKRSDMEKDICFICCSDPPNMVFVDCGHGGVCTRCTLEAISKNSQCPLCRNPVTKIVEIDVGEDTPKDVFKVVNTFYVSCYEDEDEEGENSQ